MISKNLGIKLENTQLYKLDKEGFDYEIYIIKNTENSDIINSILVYPEPRLSFYIFSTKLKITKIRDKKGQYLQLSDYFNNKKASINSFCNSEIILTIEADEIYTNINLLEFGKDGKYIYSITIKKNEYYVLWRDPNFQTNNMYNKHLKERQLFCIKEANMNIYCIKTIEEALKFIVKRKRYNDKIIFITNAGLDLSGKRFIEILRTIYNFDVMVLVYSKNKKHFSWITNFPNCLFSNRPEIFQDYLLNYTEEGLKILKGKVEEEYKDSNLKLQKFSPNFLSVPKEENIIVNPISRYIRHVKIFSKSQNRYLCMQVTGNKNDKQTVKIIVKKDFSNDCLWDITILNNTITFYSNNFYLEENNGNAVGHEFMIEWFYRYSVVNNEYHYWFISRNTNKVLSIEKDVVKINKINITENDYFILEDVYEKEDTKNILFQSISSHSDLSKKIVDEASSKKLDESKSSFLSIYS